MSTTISVIITTYNRYSFVQKALQSVKAQTRPADEILIIDDASEDETPGYFESRPDILFHRNQKNLGVSASRNIGLEKAKGEWICFLDSDDAWHPQKLEKQLQAAALNPERFVLHTNEIWIRRGRRVNQGKRHEKHGGWIFEKCLPLCVISPSSVMIHKNVFQHVGNFDLELPACEDYDLWLRICLQYPVVFVDEPLVLKTGGHADQLSHKYFGMDRFRIRALEKILHHPLLTEEKREAVILEIEKKAKVYAQGCLKREKFEEYEYYKNLLGRLRHENRVAVS